MANSAPLLRFLENSGHRQLVVSVGTVLFLDKYLVPRRQHRHFTEAFETQGR